jgi:hypothetical protein
MQMDELDSVSILLKDWEIICGISEPLYRAKILFFLKTLEFNDSLLADEPLNFIFNYQSRMDIIQFFRHDRYAENQHYYGYVPAGERFDNFTRRLAFVLKDIYHPESVEYLLCEFYSDDYESIISNIQFLNDDSIPLKKHYRELLEKSLKMPEFHLSLLINLWIPTGELKKIGVHPEFALQMGCKKKKMNYDFVAALKLEEASKEYLARRDNFSDWDTTKRFFGGYFGFETGYDIFARNRHEIQVTCGAGYDFFYVLYKQYEMSYDDYYQPFKKSAATSSYNLNFGVSYRYYFSNHGYIGLRLKYNIVDYSLNKRIDFTGNPVIIQLSVGFLKSAKRDLYLNTFGYAVRR